MLIAALAMTIGLVGPAAAINKCSGPDGKVVFQDAPCTGKGEKIVVKPAAGDAPASTSSSEGRMQTESQRLEQQLSRLQIDRRRRDLEIALPNAYSEQASHSAACDAEMRALQAKKTRANNNLAGATWEQSISSEMNAVARRCETRSKTIEANIEATRKECHALGGCK